MECTAQKATNHVGSEVHAKLWKVSHRIWQGELRFPQPRQHDANWPQLYTIDSQCVLKQGCWPIACIPKYEVKLCSSKLNMSCTLLDQCNISCAWDKSGPLQRNQSLITCEADVCQEMNTCILELLNGGIVFVQDLCHGSVVCKQLSRALQRHEPAIKCLAA